MNPIQQNLHAQALKVVREYQLKEVELISLLQQIESKGVFLALSYPSLFQYCISGLKLSEERASNLITVERKCRDVPALKDKMEEGKITLTKARRISSVLTPENQEEWFEKAETLSKRELEKKVAEINPEVVRESVRAVSSDRYALKLGISEELLEKLRRIQTLLSNQRKKPVSLEEVLEFNAEEVLKKKDPLRQKKSSVQGRSEEKPAPVEPAPTGGIVTVERKPISAPLKRAVLQRDRGQCQFKSPEGKICGSPYFIHLHHEIPVSEGGANTLENLVVLCSAHHRYHHSESSSELLGSPIL